MKPASIIKPTRKQIGLRFSASLMSNYKWRKMFSMLGPWNANLGLKQAIVKFIDDETEHVICFPGNNALRTPWSFIDLDRFGPTALSSIEWIEFPAHAEYENRPPNGTGGVRPTRIAQDIDKAEAVIKRLGKYPVERT